MDAAPVAQMDRAADFESVGRVFEPPQARQISPLPILAFQFAQSRHMAENAIPIKVIDIIVLLSDNPCSAGSKLPLAQWDAIFANSASV